MGIDARAPKRVISLTLDDDLLRRAGDLTGDLAGTIETLLMGFVATAGRRATTPVLADQIGGYVAAHEAFVARHGAFADEHSPI